MTLKEFEKAVQSYRLENSIGVYVRIGNFTYGATNTKRAVAMKLLKDRLVELGLLVLPKEDTKKDKDNKKDTK